MERLHSNFPIHFVIDKLAIYLLNSSLNSSLDEMLSKCDLVRPI